MKQGLIIVPVLLLSLMVHAQECQIVNTYRPLTAFNENTIAAKWYENILNDTTYSHILLHTSYQLTGKKETILFSIDSRNKMTVKICVNDSLKTETPLHTTDHILLDTERIKSLAGFYEGGCKNYNEEITQALVLSLVPARQLIELRAFAIPIGSLLQGKEKFRYLQDVFNKIIEIRQNVLHLPSKDR
jgi:hypothetical protein